MTSNNARSFARALIQTMVALVMVFSAAASVSPAGAAAPPANDDFATPVKMTASFSGSIRDMTGATSDAFDPFLTCDGGGTGEASVWYTYTANVSGEATIKTANSGYDTIITIFKADTYGNLIEVGCNDDATALTKTSAMVIPLRGGMKYYVEVVRKTGTVSTPPDKLQINFNFAAKTIALPLTAAPFFYDGTSTVIRYSPTGWLTYAAIPPGLAYNGTVNVGNNTGDAALVYFDGWYVQICYVLGPVFGNMDVFVDGVYVQTLGQNSGTYSYNCWDSPLPPIAGSVSLLDDNVHKIVLKNAGPAKVNIDTIQVFAYPDFWPPDPIFDLTATTGTSTGKVTLKWTATGDDGTFGRVTRNELRYSSSPFAVFPADWDNATRYSLGLPNPVIAGGQQTVTLTGLAPGVTYYFMVVGVDEAGNMGDPSASSEASAVAYAPPPFGPGFYDDKHPGWIYSGVWSALKDNDSINDSLHQANKLDSRASFYFTGTQFILHYNADFNQGLMDLYIDGVYETTIDQYAPSRRARTYVSDMLTSGPHSVILVQNSLPYINIDGITISAVVDGGPPDPIADLTAVTGAIFGTVDLTWTATGDDPGGVGTATKYEVRFSTAGPILTQLDWEKADPVGGVIPAPQPAGFGDAMTVSGLWPNVTYWFAVQATDNAHYSVLSNTTSAAASDGGLPYQPAGFYEDSDLAWIYDGAWIYKTGLTFASNNDQHQCSIPASTATFLFNGTGFTLTYQRSNNFTNLQVYVDGVKIGVINQKSLAAQWQRTATFNLGGPAANHVVRFVCSGANNIDAITILP